MNNPKVQIRDTGRLGRLTVLPYEVVIALLCILSGMLGLLNPDTVADNLTRPSWLVSLLSAIYGLSGVFILVGLWRDNVRTEVAGQLLLLNGVLTNTLAAFIFQEPELIKDNLVFFIVLYGTAARLYQVFKGRRVVQIEAAGVEA